MAELGACVPDDGANEIGVAEGGGQAEVLASQFAVEGAEYGHTGGEVCQQIADDRVGGIGVGGCDVQVLHAGV